MKLDITTKRDHLEVFASNAVGAVGGKVGGKFLQVLIQIVLARSLGAELYGTYSIGWTVFTLLAVVAPLGMDNGIVHFASKYLHEDKAFAAYIVRTVQLLSAVSGCIAGTLIFIFASQISYAFGIPQLTSILQILGITLPFFSTLRVTSAATSLSKQTKYSIFAEDIGQPLVNLLLLIIVLLEGWGILEAASAVAISFLLALLIALHFAIRLFPATNPTSDKKQFSAVALLQFSVPTFLASLFLIFIVSGNRLLLGFFKSPLEAGIFQAVSQVSIVFSVILSGLNLILPALITDLHHAADLDRLNILFKIGTKWSLYISIPLFLLIVFFPREIVDVVFGQEYLAGSFSLVVLSISQLINAGTGPVGLLLMMTGKQKDWLYISFGTFIITLLLSVVLIPEWGLNGAAVSTALGTSSVFIFSLFRLRTTLKLWPYDLRYWKGFVATLITVVTLFIVTMLKLQSPLLKLTISGVLCFLIFGLTLSLLKFDPEDLKLFNQYYKKPFRQSIEKH